MNASLRDLGERAAIVTLPDLDVAALVASGERRLRRRRTAITTGGVAAVVALVVAGASLTGPDSRTQDPINDPTESPSVEGNLGPVRPLTYAVGDTIHYGERSIDVGGTVQSVAVTDDGVAFVLGPGLRPGRYPLWFTDGSSVEQVGTVYGSSARDYGVTASDAGSTLVWYEPVGAEDLRLVIFDTRRGEVLDRFAAGLGPETQLLSVHSDAVYWAVPSEAPCELAGDDCLFYQWVMRYDVEAGAADRVSGTSYDANLRNRPRTIFADASGDPEVPGTFPEDRVTFELRESTLVAVARDFLGGSQDIDLSEGRTGEAIRLTVPPGTTDATTFELTQWLDDDRVALFAYTSGPSEYADEGEFFSCALSTGTCELEAQGRVGSRYQAPRLD